MYPEQSVTNSLPPFGDCDVNASVRQLPLYDLAMISIKGPIFQRILIPFTSGILNNLDINISLISNCCFLIYIFTVEY